MKKVIRTIALLTFIICFTFTTSTPTLAASASENSEHRFKNTSLKETHIQEVYKLSNGWAYFEQTDNWTLNAVLFDSTYISFSKAYSSSTGSIYAKTVCISDSLSSVDFEKVSTWEKICSDYFVEDNLLRIANKRNFSQAQIENTLNQKAGYLNTAGVLLEKIRDTYGAEYSSVRKVTRYYNGTYLGINESLSYSVYPVGEVDDIDADSTVTMLASLVNMAAPVVGSMLGLAATDLLPRNAIFYEYDIIVYQDKVGVVSGQTYYVATKESQHKGIDCVSDTSYEPTLDTTPYDIDYWPYQSIYEDNDLFLDQLADIYFN